MNARSLAARLLLPLCRAAACRSAPAGAVRMVILHDVSAEQMAPLARLVDHLGRRYGLISPEEAESRLLGRTPPDGRVPVLLTFDDGFRSNFQAARQVLAPRGIKALFFVCPGLIDLPEAERRPAIARHVFRGHVSADALPSQINLMGWDELADLARDGHAIGCHSLTHDRLAGLDSQELARQVATAQDRLSTAIGPSPWFAFPFGDIGSIDAPALAAIARRFTFCRSGVRGLAHAGLSPLALPAESVDLGSDWAWQCLAAEGGLSALYCRARATLAQAAATS